MAYNNSMLENGLDFVVSALNSLNDPNAIKYSLLHLSSGIELVFKERLSFEHWTYVFADMNKAKVSALTSGDFKSADSETIIERLQNLCEIKFTLKEIIALKTLRNKRNKMEHYKLQEHTLSIESSVHESITILIRIMAEHYNIDGFNNEERALYEQIKSLLRNSVQHYNDAKVIAQKELEQSGMKECVITCPDCGEKFLLRDVDVNCVFCGYATTGELAATDYISNILGISEYRTVKHGGEFPQYYCPECENESLVFDCNTGEAICFSCEYEGDIADFSSCNYCGAQFLNRCKSTICTSCWDYVLHKDD